MIRPRLTVIAAAVAGAVTATSAFAPCAVGPAHAQGAGLERSLLAPPRQADGEEPSALPLADEQKIERARNLARMGYGGQAEQLVADVAARHPDDLDVLLARVELMSRTKTGDEVLRFFEEAGSRGGVEKQLATRPRRAGVWHRYRAEALFAAGRPGDGAKAVLAAWEASPEQAAWARVRLADATSADASALAGASAELRHAADRHADRQDLALAAAEDEARAGQVRAAIRRLQRVNANAGDAGDARAGGDSRRGAALWQFGLAMLESGEGEAALADSAFAALALDPEADPDLKRQATDRLFDTRREVDVPTLVRAAVGGQREPAPTGSQVVRLRVDDQGHLVMDNGEPTGAGAGTGAGKPAAKPSPKPDSHAAKPATGAMTGPAAGAPLASLERIWHGLPASRETVRRGLDLAERMRAAGDAAGAARVEDAAGAMSRALPGGATDDDPELAGRLALREGDAALTAGDLPAAATAYERAAQSQASDRVKEEAEFEACETAFYAGQFDSAASAYDRFARAHPSGRFTNDALERAYLVESGEGGPVRGLAELAKALRLARTGASDDALAAATAAEQASADGPVWAHAELLLADLLVARGRPAEAVAKAVNVAETKPDDRLAPAARKKAGDLYHAAGQDALAIAQYDALLLRYPRSWLAPEARRAANELRAKTGGTP